MEVAFTARAGVNFLLWEVEVERKEDDEERADLNHARVCDMVRDTSDAKR